MTAKEFYRNYEADLVMNPLNLKLMELIENERPYRIFEFGCGIGKHLDCWQTYGMAASGIDISQKNIDKIKERNTLLNVLCGDETILHTIESKDIVFTCSVLCHIPEIDEIIQQFKRIANHKIFIAETNDIAEPYHYPHDYESYGFTKVSEAFISPGNGLTYFIWEWKRN